MLVYIVRRVLWMIPTLFVISTLSFILIQLPPGDYLTSYIMQLSASGEVVEQALVDSLRKQYGLDRPFHVQYFKWMTNILRGDFGYSFEWEKPVKEITGMPLSLAQVAARTMFSESPDELIVISTSPGFASVRSWYAKVSSYEMSLAIAVIISTAVLRDTTRELSSVSVRTSLQ